MQKGDCLLSMKDSTTYEGWLRKSNFKTDPLTTDSVYDPIEAEVRMEICRKFADL